MALIKKTNKNNSLIAKITFFFAKRKVGKIPNPMRIMSINTPILLGYGLMELAQERAKKVSHQIKLLTDLRIATLIGCPF